MNRRIVSFIFASMILFLVTPLYEATVEVALGSPATTIFVDPPTSTVAVGKTFVIDIQISDVSDLYGWEFKLRWNSTLLDALNVTEGNFLKQRGETFFTSKTNNTEGYILVDCTLLGNVSGVNGSGTLANVKFYAENQGESILDLYDTILVSSLEQPITHMASDGTVTISKPVGGVGGILFKVSELKLLTPWIGMALLSTFAVTTIAVFIKSRNCQKKYGRKKKHDPKKKSVYRLVAVFFILLISYIFCSSSHLSSANVPQTFQFKAAIVDHLSFTQPNQTFIQTATDVLKKAGFTVDYYKSEAVNVEFYRNLPAHSYGLIVLRVHSGLMLDSPTLGLFTSERYEESKYAYEQLTNQLWCAVFSDEDREKGIIYFAISPLFVKHSMNGKFENAIIIMMGCNGLTYTSMAEAFIEKGANVYISWGGSVLASHTDQATTCLLQHIVAEKQTIKKAIVETMKEMGPDPVHKSVLTYYPIEAGNYMTPKSSSNLIINVAEINLRYFKREIRTL